MSDAGPSMPPSSVRAVAASMALFATVLLAPVLTFSAVLGLHWVESEQQRSTDRLGIVADALAAETARFVDGRIAVLDALATSPAFDRDDLARFERQATDLFDVAGIGVVVRDPSGQVRASTAGTPGANVTERVVPSGPRRLDLEAGPDRSGPVVVLDIPVVRDARIRYVLSAVLHPVAFDDLLRRGGLADDQFATLTDRSGRVIGRSASSPVRVGEAIKGFAERTGERGFWSGPDGRGMPVRLEFRRLDNGWMLDVGMTQAAFSAPLAAALRRLAALAGILALVVPLLAVPVARRQIIERRRFTETTDMLRLAQAAAGAGIWEWDPRRDRLSLSPASASMHGLPVAAGTDEPVILSIAEWKARIVAGDLPDVWRAVQRNMAKGTTNVAEFRTRPDHGGQRWIQSFGHAVARAGSGRPERFVGLHLDVTERREVEEALRASEARLRTSEERLALALDSGEDGLFDWNLETDEIWVSNRWLGKIGAAHEPGPRRGTTYFDMIHSDDRAAASARLTAHLSGATPALDAEYRSLRPDGTYMWVLTRARVANRDAQGRALRLVGTMIDISHRKESELHIAHLALHDALTDLPNRNLFRRRLDLMLGEMAKAPGRHAVLACDLDRFKAVNDTLGHPVGDRVLCAIAGRIRATVRDRDTVARLGGDEFALILTDIDGESAALAICERIIGTVEETIHLDGTSINIGVSIGVALATGGDLTGDEIFRRADVALYQAKAAGRNTFRLFDAATHAHAATRGLLALDMKEAIKRGDFFMVYQPVVDVTTGAILSFEALMRWRHPIHGEIQPGEFIAIAEETGLIVQLGAWALTEACSEASGWADGIGVGVNVSAVQFRPGLEETVAAALAASRLPARRLKLEVTESLLIGNPEQAVAALHRLRDLGVQVALDDFGTGYSSLSYLRRFPFDVLKIDRAFVRDISDPDAAAIVRAVVGIGERLGMRIVAEGVETVEQLEIVRREGCTEVQGYLFSKPLTAVEAATFVPRMPFGTTRRMHSARVSPGGRGA